MDDRIRFRMVTADEAERIAAEGGFEQLIGPMPEVDDPPTPERVFAAEAGVAAFVFAALCFAAGYLVGRWVA